MSGMFFHVGADFDKLKKLKDDIDDIKVKLEGMDKAAQTQEFEKLEKDLQDLTKEFNKSAEAAAVTAKEIEQANHKIENTFDNSAEATKAFLEELNRSGKSVQSVVDDIEQSRQRTAKLFKFDPNATGLEALKQQLEIQKKIVAELELQYEKTKAIFDSVNIGTQNPEKIAEREKASKLFREVRAELNGEKQGLQELEKEYTKLASEEEKRAKKAEANANKQLTIMTQMRQIREEMGTLLNADGTVSPENLKRYDELKAKLQDVGTAYRVVQQEQKNLTTAGNAQLAGLINGISGFSGAYAAGQGFVSLFVKDTERLAAIQTKLQAALSMTIGIQSAANALSVTSAFRINVMNRVTSLWTATQNRLTTALWGSTLAAKALMTVASLGLGLVIMGLISLYNRYTAKQEEALQKYKELREATTKHTAEVEKEETALVGLLLAIKNTNEGTKSRISLLKQLGDNYPSILKYINNEKASNEELAAILKIVNAEYDKKYKIAKNEGQIDVESKAINDAKSRLDLVNDLIDKLENQGYRKNSQEIQNGLEILNDGSRKSVKSLSDLKQESVQLESSITKSTEKIAGLQQEISDIASIGVDMDDYSSVTAKMNELALQIVNAQDALTNFKTDAGKKLAQKDLDDLNAMFDVYERRASELLKETNTEAGIDKRISKLKEERSNVELNSTKYNELTEQIDSLEKRKPSNKKKDSSNDKTLKKEQKFADELIALKDKNAQAELNLMEDNEEKRLAQIELDYNREIDLIKKKEKEWTEAQGGKLTPDQSAALVSSYELAEKSRQKAIEAIEKETITNNLKSQLEYLKEYGTIQQKKLTIAEEYAKKIREAEKQGNTYEAEHLRKQQQADIAAIDIAAIKADIDWTTVFGEFSGMFKDVIKTTLDKAKEYVKTDEFKNSDPASQKAIIDGINQMEKAIGGGSGLSKKFKDLGASVQSYHDKQKTLLNLELLETNAKKKLAKATKDYEKALKDGTKEQQEVAQDAVVVAKANAESASNAVKNQSNVVKQSQQEVSDTANSLNTSMQEVTEGLSKMASGGFADMYYGLIEASRGIGGAMDKVADSLESVPIIGWILSIIDILKDGLSNLVGSLLDAIFSAVGGILEDVLSGDLIMTIVRSISSGLNKIFNAISFGGFGKLTYSLFGGNAKETEEKISQLTSSNEALKVSVDALRNEISGANGVKSIQAYNEAVDAQKRYSENLRQILDAQMRYSSAHHSNAYYWDLDKNSLKEVNKLLGTSLKNSWNDFSKLTADQMNEIRKHLPDVWSEMINEGKYGARFKDDWNNYADQAGKIKEMTEELRENIAQISFDSLRDSFVNTLMDMDSDVKSFAGNFNEYLTKALLNFAIGDILDDGLKQWYDSWTDTMNKQDGELTSKQIEQYRKQWDDMVQMGLDKRDEIAKLTGYDTESKKSQNSTKGYSVAMDQDTGGAILGRVMGVHETDLRIEDKVLTLSSHTSELVNQVMRVGDHAKETMESIEEIKNIQLHSYYELKDINKNTSRLHEMSDTLDSINSNLKELL